MHIQGFITEQGLAELKNYKYKSGQYTWLDNRMNPYWEWVVSFVPEWVAPNLITFIGWIFVIMSYACMLCYDYTFQKDIPSWCFFFAAFCAFTYSTLDAIDGKQARRTKSSSPLGQLFDHGCDSFSITFFILGLGQAAKLGSLQMFVLFVAAQFAFWTSNWTEYNTGILKTNVGQFGVTESEMITMVIHILTGIFGQNVWNIHIIDFLPVAFTSTITNQTLLWSLKLELGGFIAYYFGGLIIALSLYSFIHTFISSETHMKPIKECFTFYIIVACEICWFDLAFYQQYSGVILLNFGLLSSLIICKVIISSVAKMKLPFFHFQIIPLIVATVLMRICQLFELYDWMPMIEWTFFVVNLSVILSFLYTVIKQITEYLRIYCFSLQKRDPIEEKKQQ